MNQFVAYLIHTYYIPLVSPWSLSWRMKLVWISWAASWCRRWRPGPGWRPPLWRRCPACCPRRCGRCCVCWVSAPRPPWRMSPGDHRCADILTLTPVKEKTFLNLRLTTRSHWSGRSVRDFSFNDFPELGDKAYPNTIFVVILLIIETFIFLQNIFGQCKSAVFYFLRV